MKNVMICFYVILCKIEKIRITKRSCSCFTSVSLYFILFFTFKVKCELMS